MMTSNAEQLSKLFFCLGFGVWLNLYYRLWTLSPPVGRYRQLKRFIRDWLFAVSSAVVFFLFSLAVNAGIVRLGMLVAAAVGFAVANHTIGRWFSVSLRTLARLFTAVSDRVCIIFRHLAIRCRIFLKKILIFFKKSLRSLYSLVYNRKR